MIVAKLSSILYPFGCSCFWRNVLSNTSMRGRVIHTFSVQLFWLFLMHIQQLPVYIIIWPLFYLCINGQWFSNPIPDESLIPLCLFSTSFFYLLDSSYEAWRAAVSETLLFLVFLPIQYIFLCCWCVFLMWLPLFFFFFVLTRFY